MSHAYILLVAVLALISGCDRERVVFVLLDTSGSVRTPELVERHVEVVGDVVAALEPGDRLFGDRISDTSIADARLALDVEIPSESVFDNTFRYQAARDTAVAEAQRQAAALFEVGDAPCTDIIGGIEGAGRVLAGYPEAERRLLLTSDMVSTCPLDLLSADLSDEAIADYIETEREAGRLPDLGGVEVWVAGAGSDERLSRDRRLEIERFWQAYFAAAGARLAPEHYGPTLLAWS